MQVQEEGSRGSRGFATQLGRGLDIGTASQQSARVRDSCDSVTCPPVLELRQLLHYQPVSPETRSASV